MLILWCSARSCDALADVESYLLLQNLHLNCRCSRLWSCAPVYVPCFLYRWMSPCSQSGVPLVYLLIGTIRYFVGCVVCLGCMFCRKGEFWRFLRFICVVVAGSAVMQASCSVVVDLLFDGGCAGSGSQSSSGVGEVLAGGVTCLCANIFRLVPSWWVRNVRICVAVSSSKYCL